MGLVRGPGKVARSRTERVRAIARAPLTILPRPARLRLSHGFRRLRELRRARDCGFIVLSRAKSGRTWLRAMLSRLYQRKYGLREAQLLEFDNFHKQNREIPKILFTHGQYLGERFQSERGRAVYGAKRIIFLVRHPCDIAVSEYFQSTRRASQHKAELHGVDRDASMFDFVMNSTLGLPAIIDYLNTWERKISQLDRVRVVRYEDMSAHPVDTLRTIVTFLGATFAAEEVVDAVQFASFDHLRELERTNYFRNSRLSARDPNDPDSFKVRRGKVGGYKEYFSDQRVARMEELVRTRLSPSFGYGASPMAGHATPDRPASGDPATAVGLPR